MAPKGVLILSGVSEKRNIISYIYIYFYNKSLYRTFYATGHITCNVQSYKRFCWIVKRNSGTVNANGTKILVLHM